MSFGDRRDMMAKAMKHFGKKPDTEKLGSMMAIKCLKCGQQLVGQEATMNPMIGTSHKDESPNKADNKGICGGKFILLKNSKQES